MRHRGLTNGHTFQVTGWSVMLSACALVSAQTVTVNTLEDRTDFGGARRTDDLPGPDGKVSFREAVIATNNTTGPQTIKFAIPREEWWLVDDLALLKLEDGIFGIRDDATTVDFLSQRDYTGDTNPNGNEVGIYGLEGNGWGTPAIFIDADHCVIHGLGNVWQRGAAVAIWGGHENRVTGCVTGEIEIDGPFNGPAVTRNVIGGTTPEESNVLIHVSITCWSDENVVIGNMLTSVDVTGSTYCVYPRGNRIGGPTPEERNVIAGFGHYGEEGYPDGTGVEVLWAQDTIVEGNYIGVTADGMNRVAQIGQTGVSVADSINTTVRNNLISGLWVLGYDHYNGQIFGQAILVTAMNGDNVGTIIEGNLIGTDATGENPILTRSGIVVSPFRSSLAVRETRIGGSLPVQSNVIAFTDLNGIAVSYEVQGAQILGNSIRSNGRLGIDLAKNWNSLDGVTQNDTGDGDVGGNDLQNFPVLTAASSDGGSTRIEGTFNSRSNRAYTIEFFANAVCDPSGHGEGETFLGAAGLTTDAAGNATVNTVLALGVPTGAFITSTATDSTTGDTSEFSACVQVTPGGGVDCDAIRRLSATCRDGKLVAKVASSLPEGTELTLSRNGGDAKTLTINTRGKGKVKWTRQFGMQNVCVEECPEVQCASVDCL